MADLLTLCTEVEARMFREARDAYLKRLSRMSNRQLRQEHRGVLLDRGTILLHVGPRTKAELRGALVELRYPAARLNMTTHVLYHQGDPGWTA